jgi:NADPH-dependent curcumin reductase CurA
MKTNRQWLVRKHADAGEVVGEQNFELVETPIPDIGKNEFLVRTLMLGTSPAQRGYIDPRKPDIVPVGELMRGRGIAVVEKSNNPDFAVGDWVNASTGWQEWSVQRCDRGEVQSMNVLSVQMVDNTIRPSSLQLGTLGSAAFAAMYGLFDIGEISKGKTVVVSAAAGGVGSMACQIAKALGCHVIGIAGGPEKCAWIIDTVGCDTAIDYKNEDVAAALERHCPGGIDIFFDNVGGAILDAALAQISMHARVVICGYISTQYLEERQPGPSNYTWLLGKRARMEGFVIWDHTDKFPAYYKQLRAWYDAGKITSAVEEVARGIEALPDSLNSLFVGGNCGIRLVQVTPDPD